MNRSAQNEIDKIIADPILLENLKKIVLERVNVMPDTLRIAVGSEDLTKEDIVRHVQNEDEIGKQVMEVEWEFLRDLASGAIYAHE